MKKKKQNSNPYFSKKSKRTWIHALTKERKENIKTETKEAKKEEQEFKWNKLIFLAILIGTILFNVWAFGGEMSGLSAVVIGVFEIIALLFAGELLDVKEVEGLVNKVFSIFENRDREKSEEGRGETS